MQQNRIVSRAEWLDARKALLQREKELTQLRDRLNAERLALPWVPVEKTYRFDTPAGEKTLAELFDGRSQLLVYHFMLAPGWGEGCVGCSFVADHFDGARSHLENHDVSLVAVSRAPLPEIDVYRKRMGWTFPWVSAGRSDFNQDFHVSFTKEQIASGTVTFNYADIPTSQGFEEGPGLSAFFRDEAGGVFHTYSTYARGLEEMVGAFMLLDRAPRGRNEKGVMDWVRRHDEYAGANPHACCAH